MKRNIIVRGLLGIPIGISISYLITIAISAIIGNGYYSPVMPSIVESFGSEINAVIFQTAMSALLGFGFAAASVIWEIESWSIAKQSAVHFIVASLIMLPVAYFSHWMEHTLIGFIKYFIVFVVIFIIAWISQYIGWKIKLRKINEHVNK